MSLSTPCPECGKEIEWSKESPYRPFCSERCKLIDLGAWASGDYSIRGEMVSDEVLLEQAGKLDS